MQPMHFNERRSADPQGVIDDLLAQIARQAAAIAEKNVKLGLADPSDGMEPLGKEALDKTIKPRPKTKKPKADGLTPAQVRKRHDDAKADDSTIARQVGKSKGAILPGFED